MSAIHHVLFVDDDPAICDVVQIGLELAGGFRTTCALAVEDALTAVLQDRPAVAVIDAVLPGVSGLALARTVVELGIPALITTGEPGHQRRMAAADVPFLAKPFSISRLRSEVRVALDGRSRRVADLAASLDRMLDGRQQLAYVARQFCRLLEASRRVAAATPVHPTQGRTLDAALLHRVVDEAIAATGADMGNLQMADPTTGTLRIVASRGFAAPFLSYFSVVRGGDGSACGAAFKRGDRIIVPDVRRSDIFAGSPSGDVLREAGVHAVQSTPLLGPGGRLIGIVSTHRRSVWCPSDRELARLDAVVRGGAEAIDAA